MYKVIIKKSFWMCGTHTFNTRKAAHDFIAKWIKANPETWMLAPISQPMKL